MRPLAASRWASSSVSAQITHTATATRGFAVDLSHVTVVGRCADCASAAVDAG